MLHRPSNLELSRALISVQLKELNGPKGPENIIYPMIKDNKTARHAKCRIEFLNIP